MFLLIMDPKANYQHQYISSIVNNISNYLVEFEIFATAYLIIILSININNITNMKLASVCTIGFYITDIILGMKSYPCKMRYRFKHF